MTSEAALYGLASSLPAALGTWLLVALAAAVLRVRDPRLRSALCALAIGHTVLATAGWSSADVFTVSLLVDEQLARDVVVPLAPLVVGTWAVVAALLVVRRTVRMRDAAARAEALVAWLPSEAEVTSAVAAAACALGVRAPRIVLPEGDGTAFLVGCVRPMIVIPRGLWDRLDAPGRRAVLLHELAHLKRGDALRILISGVLADVFWFNPVLRLLLARWRAEWEAAADLAAVRGGASRRGLASSLVVAAEQWGKDSPAGSGALAFGAAPRSALIARLALLRSPPRRARAVAQLVLLLLVLPWWPGPTATGVRVRDLAPGENGRLALALGWRSNPLSRSLTRPLFER